ncbi:MAG: hypothetical protein MI974_28555 [Chitinophagales bacterium]|nr:hypothetical protein [Chitinophagales bacterium]
MSLRKRILIAPLDWGLGHASRCVPIVRAFQDQGAEVILATNGRALKYLKSVFPDLETVKLPAYDIHYRSNSMVWNMVLQGGKIMRAIYREHQVLKQLITVKGINGVLSDNRFGCFSDQVYTAFITHQLHIALPGLLSKPVNFINHQLICKYNTCWVPDMEGEGNLSGHLSRPISKKTPQYMGCLSQFSPYEHSKALPIYDLLFLLSGPEPQRTRLEQILIQQAKKLSKRILLIQGKAETKQHYWLNDKIEVYSFLTGKELLRVIAQSKVVICRSGYSSLMDLALLQKKALLIPTPGQTEQLYLAQRMQALNYYPYQLQSNVNLAVGLQQLNNYNGLPNDLHRPGILAKAVALFLSHCD